MVKKEDFLQFLKLTWIKITLFLLILSTYLYDFFYVLIQFDIIFGGYSQPFTFHIRNIIYLPLYAFWDFFIEIIWMIFGCLLGDFAWKIQSIIIYILKIPYLYILSSFIELFIRNIKKVIKYFVDNKFLVLIFLFLFVGGTFISYNPNFEIGVVSVDKVERTFDITVIGTPFHFYSDFWYQEGEINLKFLIYNLIVFGIMAYLIYQIFKQKSLRSKVLFVIIIIPFIIMNINHPLVPFNPDMRSEDSGSGAYSDGFVLLSYLLFTWCLYLITKKVLIKKLENNLTSKTKKTR